MRELILYLYAIPILFKYILIYFILHGNEAPPEVQLTLHLWTKACTRDSKGATLKKNGHSL